jgi:hypothetical protein
MSVAEVTQCQRIVLTSPPTYSIIVVFFGKLSTTSVVFDPTIAIGSIFVTNHIFIPYLY